MGANRLNAVTDAAGSTVLNASAPNLFPSHVTVGTTVDVASIVHVWPLILAQPNPLHTSQPLFHQLATDHQTYLGQHPTAVSLSPKLNCIGHPVLPPAVAEQAVAYPAGHSMPGEYTPPLAGAPVVIGGQHAVSSAG